MSEGINRRGNNYSFFFFPVQELVAIVGIKQSFQNAPSIQRTHSSVVEFVNKPVEC